MRCAQCSDSTADLRRKGLEHARDVAVRAGRLSLLYCERCGSAIAPPDETDTLLSKLAQLANFGLAAGALPILSRGAAGDAQGVPDH